MEWNERKEYIQKKLYEKGINTETQDYIIEYVYINQKLFGEILNIDKVTDRILNNLNYSIESIDTKSNPLLEIPKVVDTIRHLGKWKWYEHKIRISPIIKIGSLVSKRLKEEKDSIIRHEIDHCATTEYIDIGEKEKYIKRLESYLERNNIKNPKEKNRVINYINKMYAITNGKKAISGIDENSHLIKLNEGITAYKQEIYDKFLGNKPMNNYSVEKKVAKFIVEKIGKEELISMHFNNDYEGIKTAFKEKTGNDLNELVEKLNEKSKIKQMLFGKMYTKSFSKKMEKFMEKYRVTEFKEKDYSSSNEKKFRKGLSKDCSSLEEQALNSKRYKEKSEEIDKKNIAVDREYEKF